MTIARRALAALITFLFLAQPIIAQTNQNSSGLQRLTQREDLFGYEAVGRLDFEDGGFCTGVLIATDLVLTAAHCLKDAAKEGHVKGIRFRAGLRDGMVIATRQAKQAVMHPSYDPDTRMSVRNIRNDVALIRLDAPIPSALAAPFVVDRLPDKKRRVSVVSYARGRSAALSRQATCGVLGRFNGLLAFNCDVSFGSSGAPVFVDNDRRKRIVALIAAGTSAGKDQTAYGSELFLRVAEVKQALRAGRGVIGSSEFNARRIGVGDNKDTGARFLRP